jgi:VWFA-related protein
MRRLAVAVIVLCGCLAVTSRAQRAGGTPPTPAPQQPGLTFRATANYVEVDAIVTDQAGDPVRDLKCDDFIVTEDGKPQNLSVCAFIDIPIDRPDPPLFKEKAIEPDVVTNERTFDGRVFMIVLDGYHISAARSPAVRREATLFIDRYMGENDIASVVHVGFPSAGQEFTTKKRLLKQSIAKFTGQALRSITASINADALAKNNQQTTGFDPGPAVDTDAHPREYMARESINSMQRLSEYMSAVQGRRKALLLFSEGIGINLLQPMKNIGELVGFETMPVDPSALITAQQNMISAATRSNVAIYSIDPRGLTSGVGDLNDAGVTPAAPGSDETGVRDYSNGNTMADMAQEVTRQQDTLRTFAEQTGGLAMVNKNDMDDAFRRIVQDNSSYYVLGYQSPDPRHDGRFHRRSVKVTRPGLNVRARSGYYAPSEKVSEKPVDPVVSMLASPTAFGGLGMRVNASVIKGLLDKITVHVTVEFDGRDITLKPAGGAFTNDIDIQCMAIDMKGVAQANVRDVAHLQLRPETKDRFNEVGVRVVREIEVPPGRYQLRVGARERLGSRSGSVFVDLEVPDLATARLGLSDLLLTSSAATKTPTPNNMSTLGRILPTPTTTSRVFTAAETLTAAVSIYDNDTRALHSVDYKATLTSDAGAEVFQREENRAAAEMVAAKGGYNWVVQVPLKGLAPGRYVLAIEARSRLGGVEPIRKETEITIK